MSYVKIGVGGPVGSGKTALIERLTRIMSKEYSICVITNDIYTKEDAEFLIKNSALPPERIVGVETGGCPHTAIREDCSMNLEAVDEMAEKFPDVQIIFIESGGDNRLQPSARIWQMHLSMSLMWLRERKSHEKEAQG